MKIPKKILPALTGLMILFLMPPMGYGRDSGSEPAGSEELRTVDPDTVYKQNCTRCHLKPGLKFLGFVKYTDEQINTVVRHMRVRANLPEEEEEAIRAYLTQ